MAIRSTAPVSAPSSVSPGRTFTCRFYARVEELEPVSLQASIQRAIRDAGFEVVSASYVSNRYSIHYLVHKLRTIKDSLGLRRASDAIGRSRIGEAAIPVNLFDIVTVVAKRTATAEANQPSRTASNTRTA